ncbi:hypothetical protein O181_098750 [Austropuccinia psidii MF-1]|uniref:Uncharacterized protein n=1 Tax=Austropuccinia psidii MF-1 TaxID=1389203 RepID=A0A9Q3J9T8_9BASI|nr:hypothetical protein [Austropuccinia psidii MF-1]
MSSKLTEITESSPYAPPPSVLCGSGNLSRLASPSMASSGHFNPSNPMMVTRQLKFFILLVLSVRPRYCYIAKRPCRQAGREASNVRRYLWSRKDGPFGKEFPVSEAPTRDGTSGISHLTGSRKREVASRTNFGGPIPVGVRLIYSSSGVPISRINTEGVVKRIRRIADSPPDPDAEGSDELDGAEFVVVPHLVVHQYSSSSSQPLANRFQSHVIPSTPRNFQPSLATVPTSLPPTSPISSHSRLSLTQAVRHPPSNNPGTHP